MSRVNNNVDLHEVVSFAESVGIVAAHAIGNPADSADVAKLREVRAKLVCGLMDDDRLTVAEKISKIGDIIRDTEKNIAAYFKTFEPLSTTLAGVGGATTESRGFAASIMEGGRLPRRPAPDAGQSFVEQITSPTPAASDDSDANAEPTEGRKFADSIRQQSGLAAL